MRIGVTGATGFIGPAVLARLAEQGHAVVALTRRPARIAGAETRVVGDLADLDETVVGALGGLDGLVHLAGLAHQPQDGSDAAVRLYDTVNAEATAILGRAAAKAGIRRFVFASTLKTMGDESPAGPAGPRAFTSDDPVSPPDLYARSKAKAERMLREIERETKLEVAIVRPPLVHGPGARGNLAGLMRLIGRGIPLPLGAIDNRRSLVGAGNLGAFIARLAAHPEASGRTFLVSDAEDVSTPDLVRFVAAGMGRSARLFPVPPRLLGRAASMLGRPGLFVRLAGSLFVDPEPGFRLVGFRPETRLDDGLKYMAASFRTGAAVMDKAKSPD